MPAGLITVLPLLSRFPTTGPSTVTCWTIETPKDSSNKDDYGAAFKLVEVRPNQLFSVTSGSFRPLSVTMVIRELSLPGKARQQTLRLYPRSPPHDRPHR